MPEHLSDGALFDPTGAYRYRLWREWDAAKPSVTFVMLNPSTAGASVNDPTIRRCISFASAWGFGRLDVVNLFALRATDPAMLGHHPDPVGPENDVHIAEAVAGATAVVSAWGIHGALLGRDEVVGDILPRPTFELGRTRDGHPRHPLYLRGDTALCRMTQDTEALGDKRGLRAGRVPGPELAIPRENDPQTPAPGGFNICAMNG